MKRQLYCCLCCWCLPLVLWAQNGGKHAFAFLDLSPTPQVTALGGIQPTFADTNPAGAVQNPALLNAAMHRQLSLNTMAYYGDINTGYVGYAQHFDNLATFALGLQYVTYGTMDETDVFGQNIGTFSSGEYALYMSAAKAWGKWNVGTNIKLIFSNIAEFGASGIAADAGVAYSDTAANFQAGLMLKNMGTQMSTYNGTRESLPFDVQIGISKRLRYLPLRFYLTANRLYQWDIRYNDPTIVADNAFSEESNEEKNYFFDNLFRHFVFGSELLLGKAIALRVGYNFLRKQELSLSGQRSLAGFSFGAGINIKRLQINYGLATFHPAGATHHFGLNVRFGKNIPQQSSTP